MTLVRTPPSRMVSTHSRPKAAGSHHTLPHTKREFQHTAARRRLPQYAGAGGKKFVVSTHSRPKAAVVIYF